MGSTARASRLCLLAFLLVAVSPAIALAANTVVVDGVEMHFGPGDAIEDLTVINGGAAILAEGAVVNGNLTVDGVVGGVASFADLADDVVINGNLTATNGGHALVEPGAVINGNLTVDGVLDGVASWAGCGSTVYPDNPSVVAGDATITNGAVLSMWCSTIGGKLLGDSFWYINCVNSHVALNVKLTGGGRFNGGDYVPAQPGSVGGDFSRTDGGGLWLDHWTIGGNVRVSGNHSAWVGYSHGIARCQVSGNVRVSNNDMNVTLEISDNTVGGNLAITDNSPTPVVSGNIVYGNVKVD
jgi:hypothetical protein